MRRLLVVCVALVAVFTALIALIRAQPEHYPALAALFVPPPGCAMPCFLGIQPGHTSAQQAVAILEAHPFVGEVQIVGAGDRRLSSVRWRWADDAPAGIAGFRDNSLEVDRDVVTGITLHVFSPTGAIWRVLTTHHADGYPLAAYVQIDGPNCLSNPLTYYRGTSERVFYRPFTRNPRPPWRPQSAQPTRPLCAS